MEKEKVEVGKKFSKDVKVAADIIRTSISHGRDNFHLDMHTNLKNRLIYLNFLGIKIDITAGENAFLWGLRVIEEFYEKNYYTDEELLEQEKLGESMAIPFAIEALGDYYEGNDVDRPEEAISLIREKLEEIPILPTIVQSSSVAG